MISETSGGDADLPPGPQADPSVIGVWPSADGTGVLACNASRAERSYCIWNVSWAGRQWIYGHADAGTWGAAGATTTGANWWW